MSQWTFRSDLKKMLDGKMNIEIFGKTYEDLEETMDALKSMGFKIEFVDPYVDRSNKPVSDMTYNEAIEFQKSLPSYWSEIQGVLHRGNLVRTSFPKLTLMEALASALNEWQQTVKESQEFK